MNRSRQDQSSGENSQNVQVGGDLHVGLNYDQARQVALDVFKANFYELSEKAKEIALKRAEEITENFLKEFFKEGAPPIEKLESPGAQSSIFEVQKAYAKTGDKDLEQRLLNVLIERLKAEERSINQIVFDEAIHTLPKLTDNEIKLLTFKTCINEIVYPDIHSIPVFENFIQNILLPFYPGDISATETAHLQYCGCFTLPSRGIVGFLSLGDYFAQRYGGLFINGFTAEEFMSASGGASFTDFGELVIKNLRFEDKYQFNALVEADVDNYIKKFNLNAVAPAIKKLWKATAMPGHEIEKLLIDLDNRMGYVVQTYNRTILPGMQLTPVGHAIAISNFNQKMNAKLGFRAFSDKPQAIY